MATLAIRLDPRLLDNPDADIRYRLPDLLAERSAGVISDDGYDYVGPQPLMVVFLKASQLKPVLVCVHDVIENVPVAGCLLRPGAVVAVEREAGWRWCTRQTSPGRSSRSNLHAKTGAANFLASRTPAEFRACLRNRRFRTTRGLRGSCVECSTP